MIKSRYFSALFSKQNILWKFPSTAHFAKIVRNLKYGIFELNPYFECKKSFLQIILRIWSKNNLMLYLYKT